MEEKKYYIMNNEGDEIEVDKNGLVILDDFVETEYKKIKNCYVEMTYKCNDLGVTRTEKKTTINVCSPISLISIQENGANGFTYYTFEFLNKTRKVCNEMFAGSEIGTQKMIDKLKNMGMSIINNTSFNYFINLMVQGNTSIQLNTIECGIDTEFMQPKIGGDRYGFLHTKNGIDYKHYIRKEDLIFTNADIDGPIGEKSGTLESQIEMLRKIDKDFKEPKLFRLALAAGESGLVNEFIKIDPVMLVLSGPSGCGKSLLIACITGEHGQNDTPGLGLHRIADSPAAMAWIRAHINNKPYILDDLQPQINENKKAGITPSETIKQLSYTTTMAGNGGRCNPDGSPRENTNTGKGNTITCMEGNQTDQLTDGGSNRVIILDSELSDGQTYLKSENLLQYKEISTQNYGYIDDAFSEYLMKIYEKDRSGIYNGFKKYKEHTIKKFSEKISNNVAMSLYTLDLMIDAGVLPSEWEKAIDNIDEYMNYLLKFNKFKSSTKEVFDTWIKDVINSCTIPFYDRHISQSEYDAVRNTPKQIRGKKEVKDGKLWVYISKDNLKQQLEYTAKVMSMTGFVFDLTRLDMLGVLEKNDSDRPFSFRMRNIEREFDARQKIGNETVLKIRVDIDDDDEYKNALEQIAEIMINRTPEEQAAYDKKNPVKFD